MEVRFETGRRIRRKIERRESDLEKKTTKKKKIEIRKKKKRYV